MSILLTKPHTWLRIRWGAASRRGFSVRDRSKRSPDFVVPTRQTKLDRPLKASAQHKSHLPAISDEGLEDEAARKREFEPGDAEAQGRSR
ncbi:hypothetical protein BH11ARM2_BH11ARM2_10510 [soil metagenome]